MNAFIYSVQLSIVKAISYICDLAEELTFSSDGEIEYYIHMNTEAMQNQYDHLMMSSSKSFCYCELLSKISCLFEKQDEYTSSFLSLNYISK